MKIRTFFIIWFIVFLIIMFFSFIVSNASACGTQEQVNDNMLAYNIKVIEQQKVLDSANSDLVKYKAIITNLDNYEINNSMDRDFRKAGFLNEVVLKGTDYHVTYEPEVNRLGEANLPYANKIFNSLISYREDTLSKITDTKTKINILSIPVPLPDDTICVIPPVSAPVIQPVLPTPIIKPSVIKQEKPKIIPIVANKKSVIIVPEVKNITIPTMQETPKLTEKQKLNWFQNILLKIKNLFK